MTLKMSVSCLRLQKICSKWIKISWHHHVQAIHSFSIVFNKIREHKNTQYLFKFEPEHNEIIEFKWRVKAPEGRKTSKSNISINLIKSTDESYHNFGNLSCQQNNWERKKSKKSERNLIKNYNKKHHASK